MRVESLSYQLSGLQKQVCTGAPSLPHDVRGSASCLWAVDAAIKVRS